MTRAKHWGSRASTPQTEVSGSRSINSLYTRGGTATLLPSHTGRQPFKTVKEELGSLQWLFTRPATLERRPRRQVFSWFASVV